MDWSDFLLKIYRKYKVIWLGNTYEELRNLLDEKDFNKILKSTKEFRKRFKFR